jgi:hypothetical protein
VAQGHPLRPGARYRLGWITTLAHRRAVDRVRSEQASRDRDDRVSRRDTPREFDNVADEVQVRLDHWQVRSALAELTDRQREAIELAYFGGHTYRDVARVLGIPEGTAKSRLRDGLLRSARRSTTSSDPAATPPDPDPSRPRALPLEREPAPSVPDGATPEPSVARRGSARRPPRRTRGGRRSWADTRTDHHGWGSAHRSTTTGGESVRRFRLTCGPRVPKMTRV